MVVESVLAMRMRFSSSLILKRWFVMYPAFGICVVIRHCAAEFHTNYPEIRIYFQNSHKPSVLCGFIYGTVRRLRSNQAGTMPSQTPPRSRECRAKRLRREEREIGGGFAVINAQPQCRFAGDAQDSESGCDNARRDERQAGRHNGHFGDNRNNQ